MEGPSAQAHTATMSNNDDDHDWISCSMPNMNGSTGKGSCSSYYFGDSSSSSIINGFIAGFEQQQQQPHYSQAHDGIRGCAPPGAGTAAAAAAAAATNSAVITDLTKTRSPFSLGSPNHDELLSGRGPLLGNR